MMPVRRQWSCFANSRISTPVRPQGVPADRLQVFLDGDDTDGLANATRTNGVAFDNWTNKGLLGGVFANATATQRPLFSASLVNGRSGATFDGTDDRLVSSLPASSFRFMHDGTGSSVYAVLRTSSTAIQTVVATSSGSGAQAGIGQRINTGLAASFFMSDGVSLRLNSTAAAATIVSGAYNVFSSTLAVGDTPDLTLRVNGASVASASAAAFGAVDPFGTLHLGSTSAGSLTFNGQIVAVLVYDVAHDATQRAAVLAALAARYGTFPVAA